MYLRRMVRDDKKGVDFGIWKNHFTITVDLPVRSALECGQETKIAGQANI